MKKQQLKRLIDVAAGRQKADLIIKNGKVVNVYSGEIIEKTVAVCDGMIAGVGDYYGEKEIDAQTRSNSDFFYGVQHDRMQHEHGRIGRIG